MIKSTKGYFGNLFTKLIWMKTKIKKTNIRSIQMIHLDELSGWRNKLSQKSEWIIWIDHTNESSGWR